MKSGNGTKAHPRKDDTIPLKVRLSRYDLLVIERQAKDEDRSTAYIIRRAVRKYVDEIQERKSGTIVTAP
jgi:hypothetical protein